VANKNREADRLRGKSDPGGFLDNHDRGILPQDTAHQHRRIMLIEEGGIFIEEE